LIRKFNLFTKSVCKDAPLPVGKIPEAHPGYFHIHGSGEEKYQSYLGIPLVKDMRLFGVLVIQTVRPKLFFMNEIRTLHKAGYRVLDVIAEIA